MKLYFNKFSRGTRPRWLLEELGVPYELVNVDMRAREHKSEAYLRVHPLGKVPAMEFDGEPMIESAAICMHLADLFPEAGLAPAVGTPDRARYYEAVLFAMTTLEPLVAKVAEHAPGGMGAPERRDPAQEAEARAALGTVLDVIEAWIGEASFLCGERFTAADVVLGSVLAWGARLGIGADRPRLAAYVARLTARPAFQRARA